MVTPCINNIQHYNFQLMHTTLKNIELLEHLLRLNKQNCATSIRILGAVLLILKCSNNSMFFNVVFISWKLQC